MEKRRAVITGVGAITPYGVGADKFWDNVKKGISGITIAPDSKIDKERQTTYVYGVVPEYEETKYIDAKEVKRLDNFIKYGIVAATEATENAGIDM